MAVQSTGNGTVNIQDDYSTVECELDMMCGCTSGLVFAVVFYESPR